MYCAILLGVIVSAFGLDDGLGDAKCDVPRQTKEDPTCGNMVTNFCPDENNQDPRALTRSGNFATILGAGTDALTIYQVDSSKCGSGQGIDWAKKCSCFGLLKPLLQKYKDKAKSIELNFHSTANLGDNNGCWCYLKSAYDAGFRYVSLTECPEFTNEKIDDKVTPTCNKILKECKRTEYHKTEWVITKVQLPGQKPKLAKRLQSMIKKKCT